MSNFNSTYKIYELHINPDQLNPVSASDLYIEVTPCKGRVNFFVSDDYLSLFNTDKKVEEPSGAFVDVVT